MTRCRILCLHGFAMRGSNRYASNTQPPSVQVAAAKVGTRTTVRPPVPGTCFDEYLAPLQNACSDTSFVAPSAPHRCTDVTILQRLAPNFSEKDRQEQNDNYHVWWNYPTANAKKTRHRDLIGLESSLEKLGDMILQDDYSASFDGILGYSQGGVLASFLCCNPAILQKLKFAVIIAAFGERGSNAPTFSSQHPIPMKSLHIWGRADRVVDPRWSKMHSHNFLDAQVYEHSAGHVVPFEDDFYRTFQDFVESSP